MHPDTMFVVPCYSLQTVHRPSACSLQHLPVLLCIINKAEAMQKLTCTSMTALCRWITSSTSLGEMFSPPRMIMSFSLPTILQYPFSSKTATSPVCSQRALSTTCSVPLLMHSGILLCSILLCGMHLCQLPLQRALLFNHLTGT